MKEPTCKFCNPKDGKHHHLCPERSMSGPSDRAREYAEQVYLQHDSDAAAFNASQDALHSPSLGLDRSVCLRDAVEAIQEEYIRSTRCSDFRAAASLLIERFGGGE